MSTLTHLENNEVANGFQNLPQEKSTSFPFLLHHKQLISTSANPFKKGLVRHDISVLYDYRIETVALI